MPKCDRDQLIMDHLGYVNHILAKLLNQLPRGVDAENLESAGALGLIEAASQFDPSRNVEFKTFSYQRIRGAILDELRRNCPLSQQMLQKIAHLRQVKSQFDGTVTVEDLAAAAGMSVGEVTHCIQSSRLTRPDSWNDAVRIRGHIGDNDNATDLEQQEMEQVLAEGHTNPGVMPRYIYSGDETLWLGGSLGAYIVPPEQLVFCAQTRNTDVIANPSADQVRRAFLRQSHWSASVSLNEYHMYQRQFVLGAATKLETTFGFDMQIWRNPPQRIIYEPAPPPAAFLRGAS